MIQSAMALRTVSIQQSPSLAEVVDKGLEKVQEKNNVGQELHNSTAFHGWVDKKHGLEHGRSIKLQAAEGFPLLLKPPYGTMTSEAEETKKPTAFRQSANHNQSYIAVFISRRTGTL